MSSIQPRNPRDDFYQRVCFVCSEVARPDQMHTPHYGGIVCLSCRAFFRRAHQKTRNPKYFCKNSGQCQITFKNRRRCQKCRYEKCIFTGMTPEAVLSEDQKHIRFRKLLQKKKACLISGPRPKAARFDCKEEPAGYSETLPDPGDVSDEFPFPPEMEIKMEPEESVTPAPGSTSSTLSTTSSSSSPSTSASALFPLQPMYGHVQRSIVVNRLMSTVNQTLVKMTNDLCIAFEQARSFNLSSNQMFRKLVAFQCGEETTKISRLDVQDSISSLSQLFQSFASLQR